LVRSIQFLKTETGYAVIDFKTCDVGEYLIKKYELQLNAYAYSILNAKSDGLSLIEINRTGLIVFEPNEFVVNQNSNASLNGAFKWVEINFDPVQFENFIKYEVIPLLAGPEPAPEETDPCWIYLKQLGVEYIPE
jgi:hypothetical protein